MARSGDTTRPRGVKAEFDPDFSATCLGGGVLVERAMRRLGVRGLLTRHLPSRSGQAQYSSAEAAYALVVGLLLGGRGIAAAEVLREDPLAAEIFGFGRGVPEEATMYRALCDLAGLAQRREEEAYEKAGRRITRLDVLGRDKADPRLRRRVPAEPEAMDPLRREALRALERCVARRCYEALSRKQTLLAGFHLLFGDATDLEVEGRCFDAARMGREGEKILRWATLMLGPVMIGQELMAGNRDEGRALPPLLRSAAGMVHELAGDKGRVLALLDSAYLEQAVLEVLLGLSWKFIIGANQWRDILTRLAGEQPEAIWVATGADAARGWAQSGVAVFSHRAHGWSQSLTIVARRWRQRNDLPGAAWHTSFLATNLEKADLPSGLLKRHHYGPAIWALYSTKQGREEQYKTALIDLGLHHPASGRLGVNQALYGLAAVAFNVAMVMRHRVLAQPDAGMRLWRMRELYFRLAGYLVRTGRRLIVRLAGASVHARRQGLWQGAWTRAGTL